MRLSRLLAVGAVVVGMVTASLVAVSTAQATGGPDYYVSLGDSLSVGYQPGQGDTSQGFADQLLPLLATKSGEGTNLSLVHLGCAGETTTSMISGGCPDITPNGDTGRAHNSYTTGSQLGDAVAFLHAHAGHVKYLTIDIGANDVDGCATGGSINAACVAQGELTIAKNLCTIVTALRAAGGSSVDMIGMSYYDPFLAEWLTGTTGQLVATASVPLLVAINATEQTEYALKGFSFADVAGAFQSTTFIVHNYPVYGRIPQNVENICTLTYMCTVSNIHANPTGYGVIAGAFLAKAKA